MSAITCTKCGATREAFSATPEFTCVTCLKESVNAKRKQMQPANEAVAMALRLEGELMALRKEQTKLERDLKAETERADRAVRLNLGLNRRMREVADAANEVWRENSDWHQKYLAEVLGDLIATAETGSAP